jgi:hypothetical protein
MKHSSLQAIANFVRTIACALPSRRTDVSAGQSLHPPKASSSYRPGSCRLCGWFPPLSPRALWARRFQPSVRLVTLLAGHQASSTRAAGRPRGIRIAPHAAWVGPSADGGVGRRAAACLPSACGLPPRGRRRSVRRARTAATQRGRREHGAHTTHKGPEDQQGRSYHNGLPGVHGGWSLQMAQPLSPLCSACPRVSPSTPCTPLRACCTHDKHDLPYSRC